VREVSAAEEEKKRKLFRPFHLRLDSILEDFLPLLSFCCAGSKLDNLLPFLVKDTLGKDEVDGLSGVS
jgi:hypothetical protein